MLQSSANDALVIHDDNELTAAVGETVVLRETIREWPLSWTQRIELADGRKFAYKSMLPPLIEPEFYTSATAPLLPGHIVLGSLGNCSTMLVDWIDAPSLADMDLSNAEVLVHAREMVDQIGRLDDNLPTYLDVGTPEKWAAEVNATLEKFRQLVADGRFPNTTSDVIDLIGAWASSTGVVNKIASSSRIAHRDLKLDHIFSTDDGYRVIDWQVPAVAPGDVDLVWLLNESGIDPYPYVDRQTFGISFFLQLQWATVAQHDMFPEFAIPLFEQWASEATAAILRASA